jgi:hypothetical protein
MESVVGETCFGNLLYKIFVSILSQSDFIRLAMPEWLIYIGFTSTSFQGDVFFNNFKSRILKNAKSRNIRAINLGI